MKKHLSLLAPLLVFLLSGCFSTMDLGGMGSGPSVGTVAADVVTAPVQAPFWAAVGASRIKGSTVERRLRRALRVKERDLIERRISLTEFLSSDELNEWVKARDMRHGAGRRDKTHVAPLL